MSGPAIRCTVLGGAEFCAAAREAADAVEAMVAALERLRAAANAMALQNLDAGAEPPTDEAP